jgi:FKBP-type peptidyl-prolyl cis-trans isomerase (trigger factor)
MLPAFSYTYPADYKFDAVKGKTIMHILTISKVTTTDRPALTDDIFKNNVDKISDYIGLEVEFGSVKEFEDYMRQQIEVNLVWNKIVETSKVLKYPEKFIKEQEAHFDSYYENIMAQNNITSWSTLYSQLGTNETGYIAKRTEYAEGVVKEELVLYEIIKSEKIRMSGAEYRARAEVLAREGGYEDVDDYEKALGDELAERTILWEIVKEYLLKKAVRVA